MGSVGMWGMPSSRAKRARRLCLNTANPVASWPTKKSMNIGSKTSVNLRSRTQPPALLKSICERCPSRMSRQNMSRTTGVSASAILPLPQRLILAGRPLSMRFSQLVGLTRLRPLARQPAWRARDECQQERPWHPATALRLGASSAEAAGSTPRRARCWSRATGESRTWLSARQSSSRRRRRLRVPFHPPQDGQRPPRLG